MVSREKAAQALVALLAELPAEFSDAPAGEGRSAFRVVKRGNVQRVHEALWELQLYFGEQAASATSDDLVQPNRRAWRRPRDEA